MLASIAESDRVLDVAVQEDKWWSTNCQTDLPICKWGRKVNRRTFLAAAAALPILGYLTKYGVAANSAEQAAQAEPILTALPFWYLRHGETDWNAQGLSQGVADIPLNATGIAQARQAAPTLRDRGIRTIVASPLARARVTAEIVGESLGLPVLIDPDLHEVSVGVQEGKKAPSGMFADWISGGVIPEGAETFHAAQRRAVTAVNRSLTHPASVLVVAHGSLFRALLQSMGMDPNTRTKNAVPMRCVPPAVGQTAWTVV